MLFAKSYICKMKFSWSVLLLLLTINAFAQINILVKDETSNGFELGIDGFRQTKAPSKAFLVTDLDTSFHYIRIKLSKNGPLEFTKKMQFKKKGTYAFVLRQNFKGTYQLRYRGRNKDLKSGVKGHPLNMDNPWFEKKDSLPIVSVEVPIEPAPPVADTSSLISEIGYPEKEISKPLDSLSKFEKRTVTDVGKHEIKDVFIPNDIQFKKDSTLASLPKKADPEPRVKEEIKMDSTSTVMEPFPALLLELGNEEFEFNKLNKAKTFLIKNAITVAQIQEVFSAFKYDNTRMQFLGFAVQRLKNPEKLSELLNSFDYDLTKQRFRNEYIK